MTTYIEVIDTAVKIGLGALISGISAWWVHKATRKAEKVSWLRDKRFKAYSVLSAELLSLGKNSDIRNDAFEGYAIAAEAILLTENDTLAEEIELFFTQLSNLFAEVAKPEDDSTRKPKNELEGAYQMVYKHSRRLVKKLRVAVYME